MGVFCYTNWMRYVLILFLAVYIYVGLLSTRVQHVSADALQPVTQFSFEIFTITQPLKEVRSVLLSIGRATMIGDSSVCQTLGPLPLIENGPSVDDWSAYCLAKITRNLRTCDAVSANLVPDLRRACVQELSLPLSL